MRVDRLDLKKRGWLARVIKNKILIYCLVAVIPVCLEINACANQAFYHGEKYKKSCFSWQEKSTAHFVVRYQDKYFDPEPVLEALAEKFDIRPLIGGIKIRLFINKGPAYTIIGAKTIYAGDKIALAHELAHVLFLQLNHSAPMSLAEGVAIYAEGQAQVQGARADIKELITAENDFSRVSKFSGSRSVLGMQAARSTERQLYAKGSSFVQSIISAKGIKAFKEFYKKCRSAESMQRAWNEAYGMLE